MALQINNLYRIRHSLSHIMAQAVIDLYGDVKLAIGPPIEHGFYYDFDMEHQLTPEDLPKIEQRMKKIIKGRHTFIFEALGIDQIKTLFKHQPYKLELIDRIDNENKEDDSQKFTIYTQDNFTDLCKGPHVKNTSDIDINGFKLLNVSGAYWQGDVTKPMLQRIYGTAWQNKEELEAYLKKLQEAKESDHRHLGKKLGLFDIVDEVGKGLVLWHPKGSIVRYLTERFSQDAHLMNGYEWVYTPHIGKSTLWETSQHLTFFKDSMYPPMEIEKEMYYLKPMNCPFHIHIYKGQLRSYRELPIRLAEFGSVYRYELSGTLHGLTRVRGFTQDDAHIFCTSEQIEKELIKAVRFSLYVLNTFGLKNIRAYISTKPKKKAIGSEKLWKHAIETLDKTMNVLNIDYQYDEGGGAFYGPKVDLKVLDRLGHEWQLSTVQFDFNLPQCFNMTYMGSDGNHHQPIMIHRALFGSYERFLGLLIEHHKAAFPYWLAPTQVILIPISDQCLDYAKQVYQRLKDAQVRVSINDENIRMQAKIRHAEMQKIPYIFVLGGREMENNTVSVRSYKEGNLGTMTLEKFQNYVEEEKKQGIPQALEDI